MTRSVLLVKVDMNRLIKHYAKEAGINLMFSDKKKLEKFANYIINQCVRICEDGHVDGWKIDSNISGAFGAEIRKRFKQFDDVKDKK